jgi:hypothetical protein
VAAFITDRALVTVRKNEGFAVDAVVQVWDDSRDLGRIRHDRIENRRGHDRAISGSP